MSRGLVLLDRDGTIIPDAGYRRSAEGCLLFDGVAEALASLRQGGFRLAVATNQSGVARGFFSEQVVIDIHAALREQLQSRMVDLDALYYCPHHPTEGTLPYRGDCACRKPHPGLLLQAAHDFGVDPANCWMVGDSACDMEAARRAGMRPVLVRTGNGLATEELMKSGASLEGLSIVDDMRDAASLILNRAREAGILVV